MHYLLSVSRTDFSARKRRWQDPEYAPGVRRFGSPALRLAYPGLVALVDGDGNIDAAESLWSPKGMLFHDGGLLVSTYSDVRWFSPGFAESRVVVSEKWCNDLHSLRRTRAGGYLVAGSGVDVVAELSASHEVIWQWWAADYGFDVTVEGEQWPFDRTADHRRYSYPISMQSTHVNAVTELDESECLATFLHRGSVALIDRETGEASEILTGLGRPHAVRQYDDGTITYADTLSGEGVACRWDGGKLEELSRVSASTSWLHDAYWMGTGWLLVDGQNSRVIITDCHGEWLRVDEFDPEWCLYEVLPLLGGEFE